MKEQLVWKARRRPVAEGPPFLEDLVALLGRQCTLLLVGDTHREAGPLAEAVAGCPVGCRGARVGGCGAPRLRHVLALSQATPQNRLLVVVQCSLQQTQDIFRVVRHERLESVWTTWVLLPDSYEDLTSLNSSFNDGTQVLAVVPASASALLYQLTERVDGTLGFSKIGRWKKTQRSVPQTNASTTSEALPTFRAEKGRYEGTSKGYGGPESIRIKDHWTFALRGTPFPSPQDLRQEDLQGRTLQVSVVQNWPFFSVARDNAGRLVPESGIDVSVVSALAKQMNFSIQVQTPPDGEWGKKLPNGSWSGIVGMVIRRDVSFAINEMTTTAERATAMDLTRPYYLESSTILTAAPAPASRALVLFSPFTPVVWLLLTLCILAAGPAFHLLSSSQKSLRLRREQQPLSLQDSFFNLFKVFFLQRDSAAPSTNALRVMSTFWYLFSFNFVVLYSAKLTAVLVSPSYERPIDSLADLLIVAARDGVLPVTLKGSSIHSLFEKSETGMYHDIYQFFTPDSYANSRDDGLEKVLENKGALIESTLALEVRAACRGSRLFHIGREVFFPQSYSIACVSGSRLRVAFDFWLGCMVESGLINKWKTEELRKLRSETTEVLQKTTSPITLAHLQGAFFLYLLGCGVAALALLGECIISKRQTTSPVNSSC